MLQRHIRFTNMEQLPFDSFPALSDCFYGFSQHLLQLESKRQVMALVSLFPNKPPMRRVATLPFYSFSTNRTSYGALELLEGVLADFYLATDIFPLITPLRYRCAEDMDQLPSVLTNGLQERGVLLYDAERGVPESR